MSDGRWWLHPSSNLFTLLSIKGSVKRFNYIEQHVEDAERISFITAKESALKEEMELTIKNNFNGKRPSGTIPLTISNGKKIN